MKNANVVTVIANKAGEVISVSPKNPEFGWVAVESVQPTFSEGFLKLGKRVAFIAGKIGDLEALDLVEGSVLPGQIVVKEQMAPLDPIQPNIGIKYPSAAAKDFGLGCTLNDQPIFRKSFYTPSMDVQDVLIAHDNTEIIKEFMAQERANGKKANTSAIQNAGATATA